MIIVGCAFSQKMARLDDLNNSFIVQAESAQTRSPHYHKTCGRVSQTRGNGRGQHIRSVKMSPFLGKPPS